MSVLLERSVRTITYYFLYLSLIHYTKAAVLGPCTSSAVCVPIEQDQQICFGSVLPYTHTILDSSNITGVQSNLQTWSGLQSVPKGWQVLQSLLCAVHRPRCDNATVEQYPRARCLDVLELCDVIPEYNGGKWPAFLECNQPLYAADESCKGDSYVNLEFRSNATCMYPLVTTTNEKHYFDGVDGCGVQCQNPSFSTEEHDSLHVFIAIFASICLLSTLIASLTFVIDWRNSKRYPSVVIFFLNVCFFLGSIGWLAQFAGPNTRHDIVCRKDNTLRVFEPQISSEGENASCTVVFFLVYYTTMAAAAWFVILGYSWHISFRKLQTGSVDDKLANKIAYFHITAWVLPLILAIVAMSLQKVDGDSLSGICFVGYEDVYARGLLVLVPVILALCVGLFFLVRGLLGLYKLRQTSGGVQKNKATSKITSIIIRIAGFSVLSFILVTVTVAIHIYDFKHRGLWQESFRNYTLCVMRARFDGSLDAENCGMSDRTSLLSVYLNILLYFVAGIMMSAWTWTKASKLLWKRFIRKLFRLPTNEPVKLKSKHKMIAEAFQKKQNKGRKPSLDFHTSHDDPVGMKFDPVSVTSQELSAAWVEAIPKLVQRRGGIAVPVAGTLRNYSDSDISSIIASRRASIDSQLSEAEKVLRSKKKRRKGSRRSRGSGIVGLDPADVAAFNAKRNGSALSKQEVKTLRAQHNRRLSDSSLATEASAQNISLDCEDLDSRRNSVECGGVTSTAKLEELTLATYSVYTTSALIHNSDSDSVFPPAACQIRTSSKRTSGSRPTTATEVRTTTQCYVNGTVNDSELSDMSM